VFTAEIDATDEDALTIGLPDPLPTAEELDPAELVAPEEEAAEGLKSRKEEKEDDAEEEAPFELETAECPAGCLPFTT